MNHLHRRPDRPGRVRPWAGAGLLLASALLVGCGGGGGGSTAPAKPAVKTGLYEGTLTLQDNTKLEFLAVVLADSATAGTVRLVSIDTNQVVLPYQISGAITLDGTTVTSNGSFTVFAPAGTTFNGSATTTCTLTGAMDKDTLSGTLSGPAFNGTFTINEEAEVGAPMSNFAGTYRTTHPYLSDGNDATLALKADGTFTGKSYPGGTLAANPNPDPATAIGSLSNGTAQFVAGSKNIVRVEATVLGPAGSPTAQSGYSGLAVLGTIDGKSAALFMTDNGSNGLAGMFLKP